MVTFIYFFVMIFANITTTESIEEISSGKSILPGSWISVKEIKLHLKQAVLEANRLVGRVI